MKNLVVLDKEIDYTGEQLRSHWIYENFNILGDAAVAFIGKADVSLVHMVDLQDVKESAYIYSSKMLHIIVEHFGANLEEIILRQRLFICIIHSFLNQRLNGDVVVRNGDDLFYKDAKLSVSIATISIVSGLIHIGINIDSKGAPVNASGLLTEMNIYDINNLALQFLEGYTIECDQIKKAGYKVKPVQ